MSTSARLDKIVIVDDDTRIRDLLRRFLSPEGFDVLLAEDEPVNREVVGCLLGDAGLRVRCATDGAQALAMVAQAAAGDPAQALALVLMDMQMPRVDGLTATRQIRTMPGTQGLPVLAFTANAFREDRLRCEAAGMDDFITKPVEPEDLFATVLRWLDSGRQPAAAAKPDST